MIKVFNIMFNHKHTFYVFIIIIIKYLVLKLIYIIEFCGMNYILLKTDEIVLCIF